MKITEETDKVIFQFQNAACHHSVYECSVILTFESLLLVLVTMLNWFFVNAMCYCRGNYLFDLFQQVTVVQFC